MENASLSEFAKHTLAQICLQDWVHERCLQVLIYHFLKYATLKLIKIKLSFRFPMIY